MHLHHFFLLYFYIKNFLSIFSLNVVFIARKISNPPTSTDATKGYIDQNENLSIKKVILTSSSRTGERTPNNIIAPPNIYSSPRLTYLSICFLTVSLSKPFAPVASLPSQIWYNPPPHPTSEDSLLQSDYPL